MTRRGMTIASAIVVSAMLIAALIVGPMLPADAQLPIHWNLEGHADGFADKWTALLMPAGLTVAVSLLFLFLPAMEPRRQGLKRSEGLYLWTWAAVLLVSATIELVTISEALGWGIPASRLMIGTVGLMLVLIGNQLGKSRSMYMVGIRTPWTLASEEIWIKAHRLGGKLMVGAGLVLIATAFLPLEEALLWPLRLAVIGLSVLVPVLYSFLLWRREARGQASE